MNTVDPNTSSIQVDLSGKYLTFFLHGECYGIPVLAVREIIRTTNITPVPQLPSYMRGVINLRGKIIPVLDLCRKFGLPESPNDAEDCIVVVQVAGQRGARIHLGLIVDAVEEVAHFSAEDIESTPDFGSGIETSGVLGMATTKNKVKTLLDIDRVVGPSGTEIQKSLTSLTA